MQFPLSPLVIAFVAVLGLWPLVFLVSVVRHTVARRWRQVGHVALLLPLWTIATSIALRQLPPLLEMLEAASPSRSPFVPVLAIGFALFCAVLAWGLLLASFRGAAPSRSGQPSVS